jgi:exopolyphosphatase/guanosine-5'-triphosphate,3'-diphosphate pyrophosphatase
VADSAGGALAAVDCGTNSTRLLVADAFGRNLMRRMRITRLGAGVDATGRLDEAAVRRTLAVLEEYRAVMDDLGVDRIRVSATSAVRDSSNAEAFLEPARGILGADLRVLKGTEEGALSYKGATADLDQALGPFLVVDVGGGSTELVTDSEGGLSAVSLDIGCVRVTERFLLSDPPSAAELRDARRYVTDLVAAARAGHPEWDRARLMVGLAGTVSALARLALGLISYDRDRIHHSRLTLERTQALLDELAALPVAARRELPAMEVERADVLVGGALVLAMVMDTLGHEEFLVSESDILDGMIYSLLEEVPG